MNRHERTFADLLRQLDAADRLAVQRGWSDEKRDRIIARGNARVVAFVRSHYDDVIRGLGSCRCGLGEPPERRTTDVGGGFVATPHGDEKQLTKVPEDEYGG